MPHIFLLSAYQHETCQALKDQPRRGGGGGWSRATVGPLDAVPPFPRWQHRLPRTLIGYGAAYCLVGAYPVTLFSWWTLASCKSVSESRSSNTWGN